jgi:hypothetical protein
LCYSQNIPHNSKILKTELYENILKKNGYGQELNVQTLLKHGKNSDLSVKLSSAKSKNHISLDTSENF